MSVRTNGDGDVLFVTVTGTNSFGNAVGTGAFTLIVGFRRVGAGGADSDIFGAWQAGSPPPYHLYCYQQSDESIVTVYPAPDPGTWLGVPQYTLDDAGWHWYVLSRNGSSVIRFRVFDDNPDNNTPEYNLTDTGYNADWTNISGGGNDDIDTVGCGTIQAGDWPDGEYRGLFAIYGAELTDAQVRALVNDVRQSVAPAGTMWGAWDLSDTDADAAGINDHSGNARHLTNTGCVNGALDPQQTKPGPGGGGGEGWGGAPWGATRPTVATQDGEVTEAASVRIALQGENVESASVRIQIYGEVTETASVRIAVLSEATETASVRVALQGESIETASARIALQGEVTETSSVRVALRGEAIEAASVRIELTVPEGEVTETASVRIALQGEATETGTLRVAVHSETLETASIRIALQSELTETASVRVAVQSETTEIASVRVALQGEATEAGSVRMALQGERIEGASVLIEVTMLPIVLSARDILDGGRDWRADAPSRTWRGDAERMSKLDAPN